MHAKAVFGTTLSAFERTMAAVKRSLVLLDETAVYLSDCAMKVEHEARRRAFDRLDRLQTQSVIPER